ncbi:MAG: ROK family protein [Acidimicrobiales bacterium]
MSSDRVALAGVDVGGTKILCVVIDSAQPAEPVAQRQVETPAGADALFERIGELVGEAAADAGAVPAGVGVALPGLVDRAGRFHVGPNLPGVVGVDLAAALAPRLPGRVAFENDASAAAWGEHRAGAARGAAASLTVTLGTGIGGGIVEDGRLLRGAHGFAGEVGHMTVAPDGLACTCGGRGCWEVYASGRALGRLAREAAAAGRAERLVELAGGAGEVRGEHVSQAAAQGDAGALAILGELAGWAALGLNNLANLVDPEVIVVGGGLVEVGEALFGPMREAFAARLLGGPGRPAPEIRPALLGPAAGAIGAALLAGDRR